MNLLKGEWKSTVKISFRQEMIAKLENMSYQEYEKNKEEEFLGSLSYKSTGHRFTKEGDLTILKEMTDDEFNGLLNIFAAEYMTRTVSKIMAISYITGGNVSTRQAKNILNVLMGYGFLLPNYYVVGVGSDPKKCEVTTLYYHFYTLIIKFDLLPPRTKRSMM